MKWHASWPSLDQWAARSVDMVPHTGQLMALASEAESILEFGVRSGVSTLALLHGLPDSGSITSVDIDVNILPIVHPAVVFDDRVTLLIGDDKDPVVQEAFPERVDLLMIDASHTYDDTVEELRIADRLAVPRIALHDYLYDTTEPLCFVRRAVDEFVASSGYEWEHLYESRWGLAVLRRR